MQKAIAGAMALGAAFAGLGPLAISAAPPTELVLAIGGEPDAGYDPLLGWGRYGHPLFQSTLLKRDASLATVPDLAARWILSVDRLTWTITLREGLRFSDGSPLGARDVAFTFNAAKAAGGAVDLAVMEAATALDDTTLEIRLAKPWITFADNFYTLGIVPEAAYGPDYARAPLGSGPYRLVSWAEGEQLIVEANPHYHGEASPFSRLTFLFTGEDTSLAAAQAGQVDVVAVPAAAADLPPRGMRQIVVRSVDNRGIAFPMVPDGGRKTALGAPIGNPVTSDLAIRQAINMGINREVLVDVALLGHGTPAFGPADGLPWSRPEAVMTPDPEAASALLERAGWLPGADGVRQKNGARAAFAINYAASDTTRRSLAVAVSEQLRGLGIAATPTGLSWDRIEAIMHAEPVLFGWGSHTPFEIYSLYATAYGGVDYYNPGFFSNPAVDQHFAAAQASESLEASYAHWRLAEWDGATGFGARGDAGWAWLVNLDHIYYVDACLDLGATQIEPHGHGWPITALIESWTWTCP